MPYGLAAAGGKRPETKLAQEQESGASVTKEVMRMLDAVEHGSHRVRHTTRGKPSELWAKGRPGGSRIRSWSVHESTVSAALK